MKPTPPALGQRVTVRRGLNVWTGRIYALLKDGTVYVLTDAGQPMEDVRRQEIEPARQRARQK